MKKPGSHWYTESKRRWKDGRIETLFLPGGTLFAKGEYPTKLTEDDLPEHYKEIWRRGRTFIDVRDFTDILYRPNYASDNHLFRDDMLFLSYQGQVVYETGLGKTAQNQYDIILFGWEIKEFVEFAMEYVSDRNKLERLNEILEQLRNKMVWYAHTNPEHQEMTNKPDWLEVKVAYLVRDMENLKRPLTHEEQVKAMDMFCERHGLSHNGTYVIDNGDAGELEMNSISAQLPVMTLDVPVRPVFLYCRTKRYPDTWEDKFERTAHRYFPHQKATLCDVFVTANERDEEEALEWFETPDGQA